MFLIKNLPPQKVAVKSKENFNTGFMFTEMFSRNISNKWSVLYFVFVIFIESLSSVVLMVLSSGGGGGGGWYHSVVTVPIIVVSQVTSKSSLLLLILHQLCLAAPGLTPPSHILIRNTI